MSYLSDIQLDDKNLLPATPEIEQERKVAIFDLLEKNTFKLPKKANGKNLKGPFNLKLAIKDKRLVFELLSFDPDPQLCSRVRVKTSR